MIECCQRELVPDLCLEVALLGLLNGVLSIENKEDGLGAQLVLALIGSKGLLREIESLRRRCQRQLAYFKLMHRVAYFLRDGSLAGTHQVKIAALGHQCRAEIGFRLMVLNRQAEIQADAVGRKSKSANLIEGIEQTAAGND